MERRCYVTVMVAGIISLILLSGCATRSTHYYSSSVVNFLYPNTTDKVEKPAIPVLNLPLKVGIAFVPDNTTKWSRPVSEKEKVDLMNRVGAEFKKYPFVKSIEIIPSMYLTAGGGFTNLDQIKTMHDIDVIALLSYDQVQHTDEGLLSLSYWTIVGAYIIRGEKNDTSTMLDAAVYDIASRKLLFRAPGTSRIRRSATLVNLSEEQRNNSIEGYQQASVVLIANLQEQLEGFKQKVKESPQDYVITHRAGYTGGGSIGMLPLLIIIAMGGLVLLRYGNEK